jgi:hypothetical protein
MSVGTLIAGRTRGVCIMVFIRLERGPRLEGSPDKSHGTA